MPHKDPVTKAAYMKRYAQRYLANPANREKVNKVANLRAMKVRQWLSDYKIKSGCVDCGYNKHSAALDFDHVIGKKKHLVSFSKSIEQAKREITKCEVRCANCHRIKTWERKQNEGIRSRAGRVPA